jgi:putative oxidoreductase
MMIKKMCNQDLGILLLRVVVGVVFIAHGWDKFTGIAGTIAFFGKLGLPAPEMMAYLVAFVELVGGIAILLGAFTWLAGLLLSIVMLVAIFSVKGTSHLTGQGGYEFELVLLGACMAIAKIHPGKYSVMRVMKKENQLV